MRCGARRSWSHTPSLREEVAEIFYGIPTLNDARAWRRWRLEVSPHLLRLWRALGEGNLLTLCSYQHHNVEEPAVLVGIGFPIQ